MTEKEMSEGKVPWPKTEEELIKYLRELEKENDDYGKAVYIMSMGATAAFYYLSHVVGASGFQASCADLDIIRRTRSIDGPFAIINGEDMLYPQYNIMAKVEEYMEKWAGWVAEEARKQMESNKEENVHPEVWKHWKNLASKHYGGGQDGGRG